MTVAGLGSGAAWFGAVPWFFKLTTVFNYPSPFFNPFNSNF